MVRQSLFGEAKMVLAYPLYTAFLPIVETEQVEAARFGRNLFRPSGEEKKKPSFPPPPY